MKSGNTREIEQKVIKLEEKELAMGKLTIKQKQ